MIVLVLGGTRSGKSRIAEAMVSRLADPTVAITYLATASVAPDDADHANRVAAHQRRRPPSWSTVECSSPAQLPEALRRAPGAVLLDSLGTWVASHPELDPDPELLISALRRRAAPTVVVSEEVGLSLHAPTEVGRRFVDALGAVNQAVSAEADQALLVVAGRAITLPAPGDLPC